MVGFIDCGSMDWDRGFMIDYGTERRVVMKSLCCGK